MSGNVCMYKFVFMYRRECSLGSFDSRLDLVGRINLTPRVFITLNQGESRSKLNPHDLADMREAYSHISGFG